MKNKNSTRVYSSDDSSEKIKQNFEYYYSKLLLKFPELKDEKEKNRLKQKSSYGFFEIFISFALSIILTLILLPSMLFIMVLFNNIISLPEINDDIMILIIVFSIISCFVMSVIFVKKIKLSRLEKPLCKCGYPLQKIEIHKDLTDSWTEHRERKEKEYAGNNKYRIKYYNDEYKIYEYSHAYECPHCKKQEHKTSTLKNKVSSKLISVIK
ncbi:MAG: hypothetical protein FWF00_06345 [Endomicrobia bacterium]|nr:hypothetical protein [Endomicrobiia bacterium]MCL2507285.1 hypothetical protein [Endomicrobiia bacterium]